MSISNTTYPPIRDPGYTNVKIQTPKWINRTTLTPSDTTATSWMQESLIIVGLKTNLSYEPIDPKSLLVFLNGVLQMQSRDYTLSGTEITFSLGTLPGTVVAQYQYDSTPAVL